jgi:ParB family chromosome partitioning protein
VIGLLRFTKIAAENLKQTAEEDRNSDAVLELIPIDSIRPNPYQPRKVFSEDSLEELAQSIRQYGLLQPINVRKINHNNYELIAGERRLRASKRAGFTYIRAFVQNAAEQDSAVIALIENLQRENLHFFEEAEGYLNLMRDHGMTQEELAKCLGKNQSTIANKLRILKLPRRVKEALLANRLTERHARALLRLHNEEMQLKLIAIIKNKNLSVKLTEDLVEKTLRKLYGEIPDETANQKVLFLMRDHRLYINSIKRVVSALKKNGANIFCDVKDVNEKLVINIEILKC